MREWSSLVGQRFGMLEVLEQLPSSPSGQRRWRCICDCGNTCTVLSGNLTRSHTVSCGCKKYRNLAGQHIGKLTVLERSDRYAPRGRRKVQLWKCYCDCGNITYKATDTLTNDDVNMCKECAGKYAAARAREKAGFVEGTQLAKIRSLNFAADNASGIRGVYLERKTGKYRARIKFKGKVYNLGTFSNLEDAVEARRRGEEGLFGVFLESM